MDQVKFNNITFNGSKIKTWKSTKLFANYDNNKYRLFYREFDGLYDFVAVVLHGGQKEKDSKYPPTIIFYGSTIKNLLGTFSIIHHMHIIHDTITHSELYDNPHIGDNELIDSLFYTTGLAAVQDLITLR